jgi:hypothetical protein
MSPDLTYFGTNIKYKQEKKRHATTINFFNHFHCLMYSLSISSGSRSWLRIQHSASYFGDSNLEFSSESRLS